LVRSRLSRTCCRHGNLCCDELRVTYERVGRGSQQPLRGRPRGRSSDLRPDVLAGYDQAVSLGRIAKRLGPVRGGSAHMTMEPTTATRPQRIDPKQRPASSRIKILFLGHSGSPGGAEGCLDTTLRHLDRAQFEPHVIYAWDGPMADLGRDLGCHVQILPLSWWLYAKPSLQSAKNLLRSRRRVRQIADYIVRNNIDLVYTNTSVIFEGALAARRTGTPHVWHVHEVLSASLRMRKLGPLLRFHQRAIRRLSSLVLFPSSAARQAFEATTPLPRSLVVPNSLRLDRLRDAVSREQGRKVLGLPQQAWIAGFVGQFVDRKNPLMAIDAFAQFAAGRNAGLLLVGEGELEQAIQHRIAERGLADSVIVLPFQQDIAPVIAALDVLVLPSRREAFGLVIAEAGYFGKPVIACRSQGPDEILIDGESGILVDQGDVEALAAALQTLYESEPKRQRMGATARREVMRRFDPVQNAELLAIHLTDVTHAHVRNC
jgi:glycosyltransferase involved in cell wall biosynthesis